MEVKMEEWVVVKVIGRVAFIEKGLFEGLKGVRTWLYLRGRGIGQRKQQYKVPEFWFCLLMF